MPLESFAASPLHSLAFPCVPIFSVLRARGRPFRHALYGRHHDCHARCPDPLFCGLPGGRHVYSRPQREIRHNTVRQPFQCPYPVVDRPTPSSVPRAFLTASSQLRLGDDVPRLRAIPPSALAADATLASLSHRGPGWVNIACRRHSRLVISHGRRRGSPKTARAAGRFGRWSNSRVRRQRGNR